MIGSQNVFKDRMARLANRIHHPIRSYADQAVDFLKPNRLLAELSASVPVHGLYDVTYGAAILWPVRRDWRSLVNAPYNQVACFLDGAPFEHIPAILITGKIYDAVACLFHA